MRHVEKPFVSTANIVICSIVDARAIQIAQWWGKDAFAPLEILSHALPLGTNALNANIYSHNLLTF